MTAKDEARAAKNKFISSLGGSMQLLQHGIGGVGISGDKGDWTVRVLLTEQSGTSNVPNEIDGVKFYTQYVRSLKALRERDEK